MESDATTFWASVKMLMKEHKVTQEQMALNLEVSLNTYKHWILRSIYPDALLSAKLARTLGTTVEFLVFGEESNPYKEKYDSLVEAIKSLPV